MFDVLSKVRDYECKLEEKRESFWKKAVWNQDGRKRQSEKDLA